MKIKLKVNGLKKLNDELKKLDKKIAKKMVGKAAREAFKPVLEAAKRKAPKRSGLLRKRIRMATASEKNKFVVGLKLSQTPRTLEGSGFHRKARSTKLEARNWAWFEKGIPSRGIPAQPFFRPALDENAQKVVSKFTTLLANMIVEEVNKK
jgi:HK97 gp10 family phage protein